ncbi:dual specificity protein phosphatase 23a [Astyanax mexicanus]|uniref:Dual specificity protein phosphatase 23 n=2 Tax=Astyanax mexicanus TaxID=7994 RepID=A0A8B9K6C2_ASTMX|nr:dual specificity protein phosphatase 23a [Astyanax mexicanus]KAG9283038.1 dual specificity protein phosphatase 23-like [Astyanax mexicanus]
MALSFAPPPNFSWVQADRLAGLAWPSRPAHYRFLLQNRIQHLVCLCESKPPGSESCPALTLHHIPIVDFTPPSLAQIQSFLSIVEDSSSRGEGVGVHCMHGHGRTGTMLACYLVKTRNISGLEAIEEIRKLRPGSIETKDQEQAVIKYQHYLHEAVIKG